MSLEPKRLRSKQILRRIWIYYLAALAIILGLYTVLGVGIYSLWRSPWAWVIGAFLAAILLTWSYPEISRKTFARLIVYILICFLAVMPIYAVSTVIREQNIAQNLTTPKEMTFFRNVLGRSYNYTELIQWMESNMSWDKSGSVSQYSDPIDIYRFGKARCGGYSILYAELCVSQGYQARIVVNLFGDHAWDEVKIDENWIRVDASPTGETLSENISYHIGCPLFYEEVWHTPPILALAFENSSVVDVTGNYRSDHWSMLSPLTLFLVFVASWFSLCIYLVWRRSGVTVESISSTKQCIHLLWKSACCVLQN
jgi:hypothetical protein